MFLLTVFFLGGCTQDPNGPLDGRRSPAYRLAAFDAEYDSNDNAFEATYLLEPAHDGARFIVNSHDAEDDARIRTLEATTQKCGAILMLNDMLENAFCFVAFLAFAGHRALQLRLPAAPPSAPIATRTPWSSRRRSRRLCESV